MAKRKEKPTILFRKTARGPVPETAFDAEEWDRLPIGATVSIAPMSARGHEQLAFYWMVLKAVVDATGRWPTKEKLHNAIKWELQYVDVDYTITGIPRLTVDSISLEAMDDDERRTFMDQAWALIADTIGTDPLSLLPKRKEAA